MIPLLFALLSLISCNNIEESNPQLEENPTLKNLFKSSFYMGAAINERQILEKDVSSITVLKNEFNSITAENIMKWMFLQPKPNSFNFDLADKFVDFGENNNMFIIGHTLIWHSQLANFMNEIKDSTTMANHIENHINTVVSRYKGRIHSWDVVNEALNEDGSLRKSVFYNVLGENYIEQAFKFAEKADPNAELVYNDYNLYKPSKRAGVVQLVKKLQENGIKINGVGMQAHWNLKEPKLDEIEKSIVAFAELGIKVMITELDITVLPNPWELVGAEVGQNFEHLEGNPIMNPFPTHLPDSMQVKLAKRYEDIFKLFLKHEDKISRVTFWGINDSQSWLNGWPIKGRTNYPLLFDRKNMPKKAYETVIALKQNDK